MRRVGVTIASDVVSLYEELKRAAAQLGVQMIEGSTSIAKRALSRLRSRSWSASAPTPSRPQSILLRADRVIE